MPEETRLAAIVGEIDACGLDEFDDLLVDLLCTCWPTIRAQSQ